MNIDIDLKVPRTIADARSQAAEIVQPGLRESADRAITEAENTATMIGTKRAADLRERAASEGRAAFDRNAEIVTDSASLAADLRAGRITTDEARRRHRQLAIALTLTRTQADLFDHDTAEAETIAADPIEYADRLYTKYPTTRPTFDF